MNEVQPEKDDLTLVQKHVSLFEPSQYPVKRKQHQFHHGTQKITNK